MYRNWADNLKRSHIAQNWPIRATILFLAAILVIGGWAGVARQVRHETDAATNAAILLAQNRAASLEQYVVRTLESADLVTLHLGYKYFIHRDLPADAASGARPLRIRDPIVDRELFSGAHVVTPNGDLVATTLDLPGRTNVADHPVFKSHLRSNSDKLEISPPLPSSFIAGTHVHASRRINGADGRTQGLVDLQISPRQLISFPQNILFKPTDLVSVINLGGMTLARREGNHVSSGQDLRGLLVMQMQLKNPNGTYLGPSAIDGIERYFSHRRLSNLPIFVTAGIARDEALAPVRERAKLYYAAMALLTLATVAIALLAFVALGARQRRASDLAESNERLAEAQRVAKIGDWEYDVTAGIVRWSRPLCEMYGRDPSSDRVPIDEFRAYLYEDDQAVVDTALSRAFSTGEPQSYEIRVRLPDGAISDRHVIAVPVRSPDGQISRLYGTDQDVTDNKLLKTLESQVAHLGRIDAMNMMASTLAHELNQPLTAASNYLAGSDRLMNAARPDHSRLKQAIQSARGQILSAGDIIKRVREMVSEQPSVRASTSLPEVIGNAISLLVAAGSCPRNRIRVQLDPQGEYVWADPVQVQQVLVNLLRNACEAAPGDGAQVTIETRSREGFIIVEVADNGPGFSRPESEIFSPFASKKPQGMGLGLSISRTIVEYHGGRIWIEKSDESGTIICFNLPRPPGGSE
ncbi:MAG: PAS domain-containing protein [Sphingosinicella sp.]|nr:PAS domain-containing protein [Sphingosinicella sp.]